MIENREILAIGACVDFQFPGSHNVYRCAISEQHLPKKKGDAERYRIIGRNVDCFALREWLTV